MNIFSQYSVLREKRKSRKAGVTTLLLFLFQKDYDKAINGLAYLYLEVIFVDKSET
mgnify:CR=1 FL=1